jgi:diguanylate cyclase (GGDEF)-like protein
MSDHWDWERADGPAVSLDLEATGDGQFARILGRRIATADGVSSPVPPMALILSLLCLAIPATASVLFPDLLRSEQGLLVWILALIPPFLLSYYRGWRGAAVALAAGMAASSLGAAAVLAFGAPAPSPAIMLVSVVVLVLVSVGAGLLSSIFHHALRVARQQALIDPQTGLPNPRHAMLHLHRMFAAAERGRIVSVVIFEIDQLESIEENHGDRNGDRVVAAFAEILIGTTRTMNLSARIDRHRFMTILDGVAAPGAVVFVKRAQAQLAERSFRWGTPTVSAGIAQYEEGMASPEVLVAVADQALYRAMRAGGNGHIVMERRGRSAVAPELTGATASAVSPSTSGETVLVVADEVAARQLLGKLLLRAGYQVLEAHGAAESMVYASPTRRVDLVVTDVVMPEMSGFRVVEALGEHRPALKAVYISGYSHGDIDWAGVPGAAKAFLAKPVAPDEFVRTVREVLDRPLEPVPEPAVEPRETLTLPLRGDANLIAHLQHRLLGPDQEGEAVLPTGPKEAMPDILVIENLNHEVVEDWAAGVEPLPDLVIALNMTWSARIRALEVGVIDVLPHDMLSGELQARVAGALRRRNHGVRMTPA